MAGANAKSLGIGTNSDQIAFMNHDIRRPRGLALEKLAATFAKARANTNESRQAGFRYSVKNRLGFKPYNREKDGRFKNFTDFRPAEWRDEQDVRRVESRVCDFCGIKGHLKRKCFKLKNLRRNAVQFVDSGAGPSSLSDLFNRLETNASDDEDDKNDSDSCWKRRGAGPSNATASGQEGR
ncbi:uncharacterized protein LOC131685404 [Topomyia yanbarensis]|uniref:uncharacterized protein LOC131685404 n=1 Tax=Topomyia yanbarensis TaxID=2498891 RepID=UPI00273CBA7A|nr:uncharacterized protein LOC131685404 [Topomyia yanbarensis]